MRRIRITMALAAVAVMGVTGVTSSSAAPARPAQDQQDIVDTAVAAGSFKTLATLLERAGLVDALRQPGPYTVFAPTDAAFERLPKGRLNSLKRHPKRLKAVLLYHVAAGRLEAADVASRRSIETLNGKRVRIRVKDSNVFVNRARVTTPDVSASNGVIHVINRVLIPRRR